MARNTCVCIVRSALRNRTAVCGLRKLAVFSLPDLCSVLVECALLLLLQQALIINVRVLVPALYVVALRLPTTVHSTYEALIASTAAWKEGQHWWSDTGLKVRTLNNFWYLNCKEKQRKVDFSEQTLLSEKFKQVPGKDARQSFARSTARTPLT